MVMVYYNLTYIFFLNFFTPGNKSIRQDFIKLLNYLFEKSAAVIIDAIDFVDLSAYHIESGGHGLQQA